MTTLPRLVCTFLILSHLPALASTSASNLLSSLALPALSKNGFYQPKNQLQKVDQLFQSDCISDEEDTLYSTLEIGKNTLELTWIATEDEKCQKPYLLYQIQFLSDTELSTSTPHKNLDLTFQKISYTPLTDEVAESLNIIAWCGFDQWQANKEVSVIGNLCDQFKQPAQHSSFFTVYQGSGAEVCFGQPFGQNTGSTPDRRVQECRNFKK